MFMSKLYILYILYFFIVLYFDKLENLAFYKKRGFQWFFELKNGNVLQYIEIKYL